MSKSDDVVPLFGSKREVDLPSRSVSNGSRGLASEDRSSTSQRSPGDVLDRLGELDAELDSWRAPGVSGSAHEDYAPPSVRRAAEAARASADSRDQRFARESGDQRRQAADRRGPEADRSQFVLAAASPAESFRHAARDRLLEDLREAESRAGLADVGSDTFGIRIERLVAIQAQAIEQAGREHAALASYAMSLRASYVEATLDAELARAEVESVRGLVAAVKAELDRKDATIADLRATLRESQLRIQALDAENERIYEFTDSTRMSINSFLGDMADKRKGGA